MDDEDFQELLTPEQYRVMRQKGTEVPHTGKYWDSDENGIYTCAACGSILFLSLNKFESEDGHPAFTKPAHKNAIIETKHGMRKEIACGRCESHLGYRIAEKHYQINSIALDFQELPDIEWDDGSGDDSKDSQQQQPQSSTSAKTISLTIGGITIGAVLGAGAMWAASPQQQLTCLPCQQAAQSNVAPASSPTPPPKNTGTTPPRNSSPTTAQGAQITTTSSPSNSDIPQGGAPSDTSGSSVSTSSADGTP